MHKLKELGIRHSTRMFLRYLAARCFRLTRTHVVLFSPSYKDIIKLRKVGTNIFGGAMYTMKICGQTNKKS